jgi:hypothetical protein
MGEFPKFANYDLQQEIPVLDEAGLAEATRYLQAADMIGGIIVYGDNETVGNALSMGELDQLAMREGAFTGPYIKADRDGNPDYIPNGVGVWTPRDQPEQG